MKKISILILAIAISFGLAGCRETDVEKEPVVIWDNTIDLYSGDSETNETDTEPTDGLTEIDNTDKAILDSSTDTDTEEEVKEYTIELEGMKETYNGRLHKSTQGYRMVYDIDRLQYQKDGGTDIFMAPNPNPEIYPYVYMNVSRIDNTTAAEYSKKLRENFSWYKTVEQMDNTKIGNYSGTRFVARTGNDWNSMVKNYYLLETGNDILLIETQFFTEAEEGFGVRMNEMLNTLEIN